MALGIGEAVRSNSSSVLLTGKQACRRRVRAFDSSRAAISASTRVRRNSSGFHRCVFAVTQQGARRRIPAISAVSARRSGPPESALRCSWLLTADPVGLNDRVGTDGRVRTRACPPGRGVGAAPPADKMERTSAARQRPNSTARRRAASTASVPCAACRVAMSASSVDDFDTPAAAAPTRKASATGPRARNSLSVWVLAPGARLGRSGRTSRSGRRECWSHRRDQPVFGQHLAGDRLDDHDHRTRGGSDLLADQSAGHRVAGRPKRTVRQPVDLSGRGSGTQLKPQRRQRSKQGLLDGQPVDRTAQISECSTALTSAHHTAPAALAAA